MHCLKSEAIFRNKIDQTDNWTTTKLQNATILTRYKWFLKIYKHDYSLITKEDSKLFREFMYDYECRVERLSEYCSKRNACHLECDI